MITLPLFGSTTTSAAATASIASRRSAVDGFIVVPPSTTRAPKLSKSVRFPSPGGDRDHRCHIGGVVGDRRAGQALLALLRLHVHVRDLDAADDTARDAERERLAGIVGVDVDLQRRVVADDEQRVAELLQLAFERVGVEVLALDDEDGAVPELRELLMDRVEAELLLELGRLGQRLARQRGVDPADDLDEPRRAGVDDARLLQHRQHVARLRDRVVAARDDRREVATVLGRVGHRADRGQHRPLDRLLHRAVRGVARRAKHLREVVALGERVAGAARDLREDHAGVAARAHQRRAGDLVREPGAVVGAVFLKRLVDRAHGQRQVRAGVAVGHGIDVQVVDPAAVRLDRRARALDELTGALPHALCLTRWMTTSTETTVRPVSRST